MKYKFHIKKIIKMEGKNWLACFEVVSQTNNKIQREEKFFFQKKPQPDEDSKDGGSGEG